MPLVPNLHPKLTAQPYRLAVIGEAPGKDEVSLGLPFVGMSGQLLSKLLSRNGLLRDACFIGNVCQTNPPGNDIRLFNWEGPEIQNGIAQLTADLEVFKPNLCVLLGNTALRAFGLPPTITKLRGSLLLGHLNGTAYKCLPSIHPAAVLREYQQWFCLDKDLRRAKLEATTKDLHLPHPDLLVDFTPEQILCELEKIKRDKPLISIDIEGYVDAMTCISIATSSTTSFILPFITDFWGPPENEARMWRLFSNILTDPTIPKVLQNCMYDMFVLQYSYNIPVRGVVDDTMLKHWELLCEMPKSLAFQTSIYTRHPYYKGDRHSPDLKTHHRYCCLDSIVTYEINEVLSKNLVGRQAANYKFNLSLTEPLLYMELHGMAYDKPKAMARHAALTVQANRMQFALNAVAGLKTPTTHAEWFAVLVQQFCFVRAAASVTSLADVLPNCKITNLAEAQRAVAILHKPILSLADQGELSSLTKTGLNVDSPKQLCAFLYRDLALPVQYKKVAGRLTDKETTDILALLTLFKKTEDLTLKLIIQLRGVRTRLENLDVKLDPDGRIRCGYNQLAQDTKGDETGSGGVTSTGRLSCSESPTGSGFNLQTVTKKDRDVFPADPGYWFAQLDLAGADGWTVAAHCKACGDPTMMDDYLNGLKPAKIIALLYERGSSILRLPRHELKTLCACVDQDGWLYFASKRVQHGSNYGMKGQTMSAQILKDSYKLFGVPISVEPHTCDQLQTYYFMRYPGILQWHDRIKRALKDDGFIISASGHKRIFFGRRNDHDTFKQACAEEPQNNTTYATNLAMFRLWTDRANRSVSNMRTILRIQPLHTVHDALNVQFPKADLAWALTSLRSYFNNPIQIAGQTIVIPFEGAYGPSWGELGEKHGGGKI